MGDQDRAEEPGWLPGLEGVGEAVGDFAHGFEGAVGLDRAFHHAVEQADVIEAGDVILRFDGHDVKESKDLPRLVGQTAVGKTVEIVVMRKGKELTKTAKLERLQEAEKPAKIDESKSDKNLPAMSRKVAGMEVQPLSDELRKKFTVKDSVKGLIVTKVEPNSVAADKRIVAGDVIVEVQQEPATSPDALARRIETLKKDGKKSVLLLVSNAQGDTRFVAVSIE